MTYLKTYSMNYLDLPKPATLILDAGGNIEHISAATCALLGYQAAELHSLNWINTCVPALFQIKTKRILDTVLANKTDLPEQIIYPILGKSGDQYLFSWYSEPRLDASARVIGSITTGIAIPEDAVKQENSYLQTAARNQAVLDNAIEAIISTNSRGMITHVNKATESILGYKSVELMGRRITCLIPMHIIRDCAREIRTHLQSLDTHTGISREVSAKHKDGRKIPVELTVTEITVGGTFSFTGIMRDISERKLSEARLKKSKEEVQQARDRLTQMDRLHLASEMSAGLAHELNQPLSAISMYAQGCHNLLNNSELDRHKLSNTLLRIDSQAQRAGEIIRNIRALMERRELHHQLTDINKLIHSTIELAEEDYECRAIDFECAFSPALPQVEIVYGQIQQVLLNLIRNACDAMIAIPVEEKLITISSAINPEGFIRVSVRDRGSGIDEQHREKIFQTFFSTKQSGMGMGLAISYSIISSHGGVMGINPEYSNGAEFFFTLPTMINLREQSHGSK